MRTVIYVIFGGIIFLFPFSTGTERVDDAGKTKLSMVQHRGVNQMLGKEGHHESEIVEAVNVRHRSRKSKSRRNRVTVKDAIDFFKWLKAEVKKSLQNSGIVSNEKLDKILNWLEEDTIKALRGRRCVNATVTTTINNYYIIKRCMH
ncbi:uncharacterized protein LOC112906331 [Agrilus planipennis]|uniref:Uncharacterized protein LOC112906331 n=1 Tax=Agrilus planipennis TaxID=224129 RepID=A0A7F5RJ60_AGRPL|nr:uncharacterized protein LOC112906331 [Agrilus planipennis]